MSSVPPDATDSVAPRPGAADPARPGPASRGSTSLEPTSLGPATEPGFGPALLSEERSLRGYLGRAGVPAGELDDVVQESFARAWRSRDRFDPARPLGPWLRTTALRTWLDLRRRLTRPDAAATGADRDPDTLIDPRDVLPDAGLRYADALATLPQIERDILDRFHRQGETIRELARDLELPEGTVKSHLHRARRRLAAAPDAEFPVRGSSACRGPTR